MDCEDKMTKTKWNCAVLALILVAATTAALANNTPAITSLKQATANTMALGNSATLNITGTNRTDTAGTMTMTVAILSSPGAPTGATPLAITGASHPVAANENDAKNNTGPEVAFNVILPGQNNLVTTS